MSFQVGAHCYATQADYAPAYCAAMAPIWSFDGTTTRRVDCVSANVDGSLAMSTSTWNTSGSTVTYWTMVPSAPPCVENDYWVAAEAVVGAALGLWALWYGGKKVLELLHWSRGSEV